MTQKLKAPHGRRCAFVAAPDRSLTRRGLLSADGCIAAVSLGLATCFCLQGMPLVLAFSGLELSALGAALYVAARNGGAREVITGAAGRAKAATGGFLAEVERRGPAVMPSGAIHRQA